MILHRKSLQNLHRLSQKAKQLKDDSSKGILGLSQERGGGVNSIFFPPPPPPPSKLMMSPSLLVCYQAMFVVNTLLHNSFSNKH